MLSIGQLERMSIDSSFLFNADGLLLDEQLLPSSNDYLHSDKYMQSNDMLDFNFVLSPLETCSIDSLSMVQPSDYELTNVPTLVQTPLGNSQQPVRSDDAQEGCLDSILGLPYSESPLGDHKILPSFATDNIQHTSFAFSESSTLTNTSPLSAPTSFLITPIYENPLAIDPTSICRPCDILEFNDDSFTKPHSATSPVEKSEQCNTSTTTKRHSIDVDLFPSNKKQKGHTREGDRFAEFDVGNQFVFEDLFSDLVTADTDCGEIPVTDHPNDITDMLSEFLDTESSEGTPDKEDIDSDYTPSSSRRSSISSSSTEDIADSPSMKGTACSKASPSRDTARKHPKPPVPKNSRKKGVTENMDTPESDESIAVYTCEFPSCGKAFTRLYNLKSHYRTHTDDRPFACDKCDQTFSRNHDLKRHYKIHSGVKPFNCDHCGKKFSRMDALGRHRAKRPQCRE